MRKWWYFSQAIYLIVELVHFIVAHVAFNSIENFMFTRRILNDSLFGIVIVVNVDIMLRMMIEEEEEEEETFDGVQ